ncbi:hypothetical protein QM480_06060 [Flectobacillus sp. DC10W]|uniref:Outer membrane protein beta-barrel domain-containing protein n=1 Tax=Flectobacillus longus TaxID=2984207 RepID=A0ABT6YL45_9BACT|nr:hypothetical protein [Flectobacillus longus]MDI9863878.1 hypothetical protein [Flectobacillus longus]
MFASCFLFVCTAPLIAQDILDSPAQIVQISTTETKNTTEHILDISDDSELIRPTGSLSTYNISTERKRIQMVVKAEYNTYGYNTYRIADNERLFHKSALSNMSLGAGLLWEPKGFNRKLGIEVDAAFASYQELAQMNAGFLPARNVTALSFALLPQYVFYQNEAETVALFVQAGPTFEKVISDSTPMKTFVYHDDIIGYKVGLGTRFGRLFTSINFSQNDSGRTSWSNFVKATITKVGLSLGYNLSK